jgi:hypothetical protein
LAWYDASQITSPPTNGGALSSWNDLSGNGLNLAQATGAKQPIYYSTTTANLLNGLPTVWFNGTSQGMQTAASSGITAMPVSVFIVCKTADGATVNNERILQSNSTITAAFILLPPPSYVLNGPAVGISGGSVDTNWHVFTGLLTSGTCTLRLDGAVLTTGSVGATPTSNPITLGALSGVTGQYLNGAIAEVILYTTTLSGANVTAIESYLTSKWFAPPPGTLSGSSTSTSTLSATANLTTIVQLQGSSTSVSSLSATLPTALVAQTVSNSALAATLSPPLVAPLASTSSLSGNLSTTSYAMSATLASLSSLVANLTIYPPLVGTIASASALTSALAGAYIGSVTVTDYPASTVTL